MKQRNVKHPIGRRSVLGAAAACFKCGRPGVGKRLGPKQGAGLERGRKPLRKQPGAMRLYKRRNQLYQKRWWFPGLVVARTGVILRFRSGGQAQEDGQRTGCGIIVRARDSSVVIDAHCYRCAGLGHVD